MSPFLPTTTNNINNTTTNYFFQEVYDHDGMAHNVTLEPGDMLLYESSKVLHGRPTLFRGSWYTSVFVHYYPKDEKWWDRDREFDKHYAIPPDWDNITSSPFPRLSWSGTNMFEPDCKDFWCNLDRAVELEGPGEYGSVITSHGKRYELSSQIDEVRQEL